MGVVIVKERSAGLGRRGTEGEGGNTCEDIDESMSVEHCGYGW
jgi:hypothetical protein